MSRSRTAPAEEAIRSGPGGRLPRGRGPGLLAAAAAGLVLVAGCGTVQASSTAGRGVAAPAPAAARPGSSGPIPSATPGRASGSASAPGSASGSGSGSDDLPAPGGRSVVARVRVQVVLPTMPRPAPGEVTGVVTLGLDRCLVLRTDAGQQFDLAGPLAVRVRTLLAGRATPEGEAPTGAGADALTAPGTYGVRIHARGSVTGGATVCGLPYQLTVASGDLEGGIRTTR